jgi:hypothetical protein
VSSIRERLRRRLRTANTNDPVDESGYEDAGGSETPIDVRTTRSPERPPSTPPTTFHVPDAALGFDPWGLGESMSWPCRIGRAHGGSGGKSER